MYLLFPYTTLFRSFVALKVLKTAARRDIFNAFQSEIEALARIQHPNIVQIYAVGQCELGPYIVMEFVSHETLAAKVRHRLPTDRKSTRLNSSHRCISSFPTRRSSDLLWR